MEEAQLFDDVLEAIDRLPDEEQKALVDIVRRRLAERARKRIVADVQEARAEFASGKLREATAAELAKELLG
jgi:hypothetical protein